jgi:hypothetical protein
MYANHVRDDEISQVSSIPLPVRDVMYCPHLESGLRSLRALESDKRKFSGW